MFTQGAEVFLLLPTEMQERILHAGVVSECPAGKVVACFADPIAVPVESNVLLHCEVNRRFMQQAARVQALLQVAPQTVLAFACTGKPIMAESRGSYRVSVAAARLGGVLNGADRCELQDISATGFGVMTEAAFTPGDIVEVTLHYDGCIYAGKACVQSVKTRLDGAIRYGLHALETGNGRASSALHNGLSHISAAVQRQQLRRLARA